MKKRYGRILSWMLAVTLAVVSVDLPVAAAESDGLPQIEVQEEVFQDEEPAAEAAAPEETVPGEADTEAALDEVHPVPDAVQEPAAQPDGEQAAEAQPEDAALPLLNYHLLPGEGEYESISEHLLISPISADKSAVFDPSYNPKDDEATNYLPPTRSQYPYGSCWAHAVMAAAEIGLIKNKGADRATLDLSELQLAYFMYNSPETDPLELVYGDENRLGSTSTKHFMDNGGSVDAAKKILQGWITAAEDKGNLSYGYASTLVTVPNTELDESLAYNNSNNLPNPYHLRNYRNASLDTPDEVKQLIMDYGMVTASYYTDDAYYKESADHTDASYYYTGSETGTNHAVSIVGWNDNYSKTNFLHEPANDGAWLIRNSWTTSDANAYSRYNYFWISYDDPNLTGGVAFEYEYETEYDNNYYYDGCAWDLSFSYPSGTKIANVYTAKKPYENLKAVAFETNSSNVNYYINIYKGLTDPTDPTSGKLLIDSQQGTTTYSGYYTVPLKEEIPLKQGDTFSVVIKLMHTDNSDVSVLREVDYDHGFIAGTADSRPGESFIYTNNSWQDVRNCEYNVKKNGVVTTTTSPGNLRIKAFTQTVEKEEPKVKINVGKYQDDNSDVDIESVIYGKKFTVSAVGTPAAEFPEDTPYTWSSSNENAFTVAGTGKNCVVTPVGNGQSTISVTASISGGDLNVSGTLVVDVNRLAAPVASATLSEDGTAATITWSAVTGGSSYKVFVYEKADKANTLKEYPATELTCKVEGLKAGTEYGYYVCAYNAEKELDSTKGISPKFFTTPKAKEYQIEYKNMNGATNSTENPSVIREKTEVTLKDPTKTGYLFNGWFEKEDFSEDSKVTTLSNRTADVILYASWTPVKYVIRFNGNGSTGGTMKDMEMTYDVKAKLTAVAFEKKGYFFSGWNTKEDEDGKDYADQEEVNNLASNNGDIVELFAKWDYDEAAWGDLTEEDRTDAGFEAPEDVPSDKIWVRGVADADYCGSAITFGDTLRVFYGTTLLTADTDYAVSYLRNIKAYALAEGVSGYDKTKAPTVKITGKNNYSGEYTKTFVIRPLDIAGAVSAGDVRFKYNKSKVQKGVPVIKYVLNGNEVTLKNGTDFECSYPDSGNYKAVGTYEILVTGKGNYTGTTTARQIISEETPVAKLSYTFKTVNYEDGQPVSPKITVKNGRKTLTGKEITAGAEDTPEEILADALANAANTEDNDYLYCSWNNTNTGTAYVMVAGVEGRGYVGTVTKTYKIVGNINIKNNKKFSVKNLKKSYAWSEEGVDPFRNAYGDNDPVSIEYDEDELTEGTDFTLKYNRDVTKTGTVKVTITGIGNFTGSITKSYKIAQCSIKNDRITVADVADCDYVKGGAKPEVQLTDGDRELVAGVDYTVKYTNNNKIYEYAEDDDDGKFDAKKAPTVTITGKGNYTGSVKRYFCISPSSLENTTVEANDVVWKANKTNIFATTVAVRDNANNQKLKSNTDYVKNIAYTYVQETPVKVAKKVGRKTEYEDAVRSAGDAVEKTDVIPVNTEIRVTVTGKGKYDKESTQTTTYRFVEASVAKATIDPIADRTYNGEAHTLTRADIKVKVDNVYLDETDFEILEDTYKNNIKKGTASVTIKGVGKYGGKKTVSFKIKVRTMN